MKVTLKNVSGILPDGTPFACRELEMVAASAALEIIFTEGRYGLFPLDTPRLLHVKANHDSVLVEDMTPGNEEKGVSFTPLGTAANDDEPGFWCEIHGGRIVEEAFGNTMLGEIHFEHGELNTAVVLDPERAKYGETGY